MISDCQFVRDNVNIPIKITTVETIKNVFFLLPNPKKRSSRCT